MKYRMLALDLDGTLVDEGGRVSAGNLAAIRAAQEAGVLVVPCTGRGWCEARGLIGGMSRAGGEGVDPRAGAEKKPSPHPLPSCPDESGRERGPEVGHPGVGNPKAELRPSPQPSPSEGRGGQNPGVFTGGAAVCDLTTGRALNLAFIDPELALQLIAHLFDGPDAVLVYRDIAAVGHDYLVTGRGTLTPTTQWWFEATGVTVHFQKEARPDDAHNVLRVGIVGPPARAAAAAQSIARAFGPRVFVHSFRAVPRSKQDPGVDVLEVFGAGVDKWRGLAWLAGEYGWGAQQVAVIGDGINDLAMLSAAGCGIAMGNAPPGVKAAARYVTLECRQDGVAFAIGQLLAGRWE
jgi:5-amino-6-(5-phospho-D-ribitylamino)uracil phosphatase